MLEKSQDTEKINIYILNPCNWWAQEFSVTQELFKAGFDLTAPLSVREGEGGCIIFYQDKEDSND